MKRQRLVEARKSLNKTQAEAAADIGISEIYLRKIENGASKPGRETMLRFEQYYGISMRELFQDIFCLQPLPTVSKD